MGYIGTTMGQGWRHRACSAFSKRVFPWPCSAEASFELGKQVKGIIPHESTTYYYSYYDYSYLYYSYCYPSLIGCWGDMLMHISA